MPRLKSDPVDIAFRAWAALDTDQKQRLADRVAGYQEAMGVINGTETPQIRTRRRRSKPVEPAPIKTIPA